MDATAPFRFDRHRLGGDRVVAWMREGLIEPLRAAGIERPGNLLASLGRAAPGRGRVAILDLHGSGEAVMKRHRRGGWVGRWFPDRFFRVARFRHELVVAAAARSAAIPVPEPLALVRTGWPPFRLYFITRRVPDTRNLIAELDAEGVAAGRRWIGRLAAAVRVAHDGGLTHPDLSLGNFLIGGRPDRPPVHLVDLVGARIGPPLTPRRRVRQLRRLLRSWEKYRHRDGAAAGSDPVRFLLRYCGGDRTLRAALRAGRARTRFELALHRLLWRRDRPVVST